MRETERQTERQTDRQKDRKTERQTDRKTDRQTDGQGDRQRNQRCLKIILLRLRTLDPEDPWGKNIHDGVCNHRHTARPRHVQLYR